MPQHNETLKLKQLAATLTDEAAHTPQEVFRRCEALEQLSVSGTASICALPAIMRTLVVPVSVDCILALRVAAAEAVWKVGQRHDLALPVLAWALKDEYWGASRKATEVLAEMGTVAHDAIPDIVNLAERRLDHGPFHYEEFGHHNNGKSLLALIATALGSCGRGLTHAAAAHRLLTRIVESGDADACAAAQHGLAQLNHIPP